MKIEYCLLRTLNTTQVLFTRKCKPWIMFISKFHFFPFRLTFTVGKAM